MIDLAANAKGVVERENCLPKGTGYNALELGAALEKPLNKIL